MRPISFQASAYFGYSVTAFRYSFSASSVLFFLDNWSPFSNARWASRGAARETALTVLPSSLPSRWSRMTPIFGSSSSRRLARLTVCDRNPVNFPRRSQLAYRISDIPLPADPEVAPPRRAPRPDPPELPPPLYVDVSLAS